MSGCMDALLDDLNLLLNEENMLVGCHHIKVDTNRHEVFMERFKLLIHESTFHNESPVGIDGQNFLDPLQNCGWLLVGKVVSGGQLNSLTDGSQEGNLIDENISPEIMMC